MQDAHSTSRCSICWDFTVEVGPGVLIPRPDTECVAETAMAALRHMAEKLGCVCAPAALDLCAGTGVLAIAMARSVPAAQVAAVEKSGAAFRYLQHNCAALAPRTVAVQADVFGYENVLAPQSVDVIVSNPPYVTAQEYEALAPELFFGGALVFETGSGQAQHVAALCTAAGYTGVSVRCDAAGLPRCVYAEKP